MRSGRRFLPHRDGGASAVEYGAVLILVAALAAVFTVVALPERVKTNTAAAICQLFSGTGPRDCPDDRPPAPTADPPAANAPPGQDGPVPPEPTVQVPPASAPPAEPVLDPHDPDARARDDARNEANDAGRELTDLNDQAERLKQEVIDYLKGLVGATEIENCLTKGDIVDCLKALSDAVPWKKFLRFLEKIPGAIKLANKFKNIRDKLNKARDRKKEADDELKKIQDRLRDRGFCRLPSSFLPGTRVLMADGSARPIERVRVGDLVWAADPRTGVSGPRPVTRLIGSRGAKRLTSLATGPLGRFGPALTSTGDHLFWESRTRSWRPAADLSPGSLLRTSGGGTGAVTAVGVRVEVARVHNLTVAGLHTYHVLAGDTAVLVHNEEPCPTTLGQQIGEETRSIARGSGQLAHISERVSGLGLNQRAAATAAEVAARMAFGETAGIMRAPNGNLIVLPSQFHVGAWLEVTPTGQVVGRRGSIGDGPSFNLNLRDLAFVP